VFGLAAGTRGGGQYARGLGLTYALAGVGFDGFCGGKTGWLAFRHSKNEYGIDSAMAEVPESSPDSSTRPGRRLRVGESGPSETGLRRWGEEAEDGTVMDEREFFNETTEQRTHSLNCPKCGQAAEYKVTWIVRRKRQQVPRGADERDRARFAKAQSYMVRRDDKLTCTNVRCRKPFEITTLQSLAFLMD
jgi:hypothetical protein